MAKFSGLFSGRANWQTVVALRDTPDHELNIAEISGPQKSTDARWNNAKVTYWGITELIAGNGTQRGSYINEHADGDSDRGTFEGRVTSSGSQVTLEGTWTITGGTGKLNGITGGGTYQGRMTSPTAVEMNWSGAYQLAETRAGAG